MSVHRERIAHVLLALTMVAAARALWPPRFRLWPGPAEGLDTRTRALHLALSVTVILDTLLPWLAFLIGVGSGDGSLSGPMPLPFAPLSLVAAGVPRPSSPPAAVVA